MLIMSFASQLVMARAHPVAARHREQVRKWIAVRNPQLCHKTEKYFAGRT
jgi:hypothetical protein